MSPSKSAKSTSRVSKRASTGAAGTVQQQQQQQHHHHHHHHHDNATHATGMDGRHKRVWKACERCRMKKTKCDGEFPCKRCKDDGLVCTAGVRKKVEYKQLPRGGITRYAEVLENTQFALIATVHKLYNMVRNSQPWGLGEPDLNDRGLPVIHDIAQKLGCIRPNSDIDLPVHSVFPEDEAGMAELARQLEEQQVRDGDSQRERERDLRDLRDVRDTDSSTYQPNDRASSSELDHSDFEDYRRAAFGSGNAMTLSPQSFAGSNDFDFSPTAVPEMDPSNAVFASQNHSISNFSWSMPKSQLAMQHYLQNNMNMVNQAAMVDPAAAFSTTIKPDILSCANPDVMMGMSDPMIYAGFDSESMRL
ncbi:Zn(2)-C6 fungal-type DNA-binding domain protein [Metarhizium rileyi]|uniref:Zn(2)-C6 fungal-type DNA-binding domain protein n=1 Tax=Metarhizium rileyi (strain RCEF 4871) TaxID=1649241 RepID=A0A167I2G5_METRR|nr:Zn(2)-C6 fungal-type DNA-binding domain protein [Metarhizium rileyi RCEF 4871]